MLNFKKRLITKLLAIALSCLFLFTTTVYGVDAEDLAHRLNSSKLRPPLGRGSVVREAIEVLKSAPPKPLSNEEYSFSDFINTLKFSDFVESIKSDTGGRLFGRFVALLLFPLAVYIILILTPFVKIGSHGPVFFGQERVGFKGKPIIVLKLRTFTNETDTELRHISSFGRATRHTGLDEVPQILSIVLGDMQWFGPRPLQKEKIPNRVYIDTVLSRSRPGIFSWFALHRGIGASNMPVTIEQVRAELQDITRKSVLDNIYLLFVTTAVTVRSCLGRLHKHTSHGYTKKYLPYRLRSMRRGDSLPLRHPNLDGSGPSAGDKHETAKDSKMIRRVEKTSLIGL